VKPQIGPSVTGSQESDPQENSFGDYRSSVVRELEANPRYRDEISSAAEEGKRAYLQMRRECKVPEAARQDPVHESWETDFQAEILTIYAFSLRERIVKSMLTHGGHEFDDEFDPPEKAENRALLAEHRGNFNRFLDVWGAWGELTRKLAETTLNPEMALRGFHRVAYGGLILHAQSGERDALLSEYRALSVEGLSADLRAHIETIPPRVYAVTMHSVIELFAAGERGATRDLGECCSLAYGPALYCHNHEKESRIKESNEDLSVEELTSVVRGAIPLLVSREPFPALRAEEVSAVISIFKRWWPPPLLNAYLEMRQVLEEKARQLSS
jgi:hypothetical protein